MVVTDGPESTVLMVAVVVEMRFLGSPRTRQIILRGLRG